ncbi:hypothetical protein [Dyella sp. C9]|nr:hypothetical protein [Dyella sp. C9]
MHEPAAILLFTQAWACTYVIILLGVFTQYRLRKGNSRHAFTLLD